MTKATLDVETLGQFDQLVAQRGSLVGAVVRSLDLRERTAAISRVHVLGTLFLGCDLTDETDEDLRARGALVFPAIPTVPFDPYRTDPYTADELYNTVHYADSFDARVYAWSKSQEQVHSLAGSIAMSLHDHAMTDALTESIASIPAHQRVGIMGGHAISRGTETYRGAAELGRSLARTGRAVFTGGGPGAMEAANLGAYLAPHDDDALPRALEVLATVASFAENIDGWAAAAALVRERWRPEGDPARSVGIPTWFYGHEPPNEFGTVIAKYFANPLREATLLERCQGGIIYLPGAGGTVSEIFMDACENYYAPPENVAPMILVGIEQWTRTLPAWPLLQRLAEGRDMQQHIHLVDSTDDALPIILGTDE